MEFKTFSGKDYFLQYHRTRDFLPSGFELNRDPRDGEVEVPFVRGATSEEGGDFKVTVYYAGKKLEDVDPEDEDGSFGLGAIPAFHELQFRRRKLQAIDEKDPKNEFECLVSNHTLNSKLFKPEVSAIFPITLVMKDNEVKWGGYDEITFGDGSKYLPRDPILKEGETVFNFSEEAKKGRNSFMNLHLVSDGRRAFLQRI
jgi:hypothetical protein